MTQPLTFGLAPGNEVKPLLLDASGNVLVAGHIPTAGEMGWSVDGNGYQYVTGRFDNTLLSIRNEWHEHYDNTNLPAGTTTIDFTAADIDQVIHVNDIYTRYVGTITNVVLTWSITDSFDVIEFATYKPATSNIGQSQVHDLYVPSGWWVRLVCAGATLGNDLFANYLGYQMWIVP